MASKKTTFAYKLLILLPSLCLVISGCFSSQEDQAKNTSLSGTWKMTPETSAHAVNLISKENPILFSFELKEDSSAILHFVDSNGKLPKTGTWSTKANTSLSNNQQTDLLIYYNDSTSVVAIGYTLENKKAQTQLISLQKEHYEKGL